MIRSIVRDESFLSLPSEDAEKSDLRTGLDLVDTLMANADRCVGMAANMIGIRKRIIIVGLGPGSLQLVMYNPVLISKEGPYIAEEGCLSLDGTRETTRYQKIEVAYRDGHWALHQSTFTGFAAQVIQHEMDHLEGILI